MKEESCDQVISRSLRTPKLTLRAHSHRRQTDAGTTSHIREWHSVALLASLPAVGTRMGRELSGLQLDRKDNNTTMPLRSVSRLAMVQ